MPIATVKTAPKPGAGGHAQLAITPRFTQAAQFVADRSNDFGVTWDSVRVRVRGPLPDTIHVVADTTFAFTPDSPDTPLTLNIPATSDGQHFDVLIEMLHGSVVQYSGHAAVTSYLPGSPVPPNPPIELDFTGPGSTITRIVVSPKTITLPGGASTTLSVVSAFDASGASVAVPGISWSSSDNSIATVTSNPGAATAVVQALSRRGSVTITATSASGATDGAAVAVVLPAASIAVVSGAGQTGKAGAPLANPAVVQVSAADGSGVAGVNVIFAPPTGGSVGTTSATTDGSGRASTTLRLGGALGPQSFSATAAGFSVSIPATATAADAAAIAVVSGNNQSDSVRKTLAPLSVRVTDSFNNPVPGITVSWARTSGSGSLATATSTTSADGIATNTYTLGSTTGQETVSATASGVAAPATFTFTAGAGGAATIVVVSGGGQAGRVAQPLPNPFVVRVSDVGGNPVAGATVAWSATNGTIAPTTTTDASGQTSATMTIGTVVGTASATASIANGQSVSFSATVTSGFIAQLAFATQPTNGTPNAVLSPVRVALRDAGGNATAAVNQVTLALGNNPNGATLSGTLTRAAVNGTATFDDLKVDKAGTGYTLVATSGSLPSVTSTAFNTTIGVASQLLLIPATPTSFTKVAGGNVPNPPQVKTADAGGNAVPNTPVRFVVTIGATTIADVTINSDASGLIDGAHINIPDVAGTYTVTASLVSAPSVSSSVTVTVTPGPADHIIASGPPAVVATAASGTTTFPSPISVTVLDAFNNLVPSAQVSWTTLSCGAGFSLGASSTTSNASGVASAPTINVPNGTPGSCQVKPSVTSGGPGFVFYAIMKPSGSNAWTAGVDQSYGTAGNWTGGVPTNASQVYIPAAPPSPALSANGVAGSITLEANGGNHLQLNTNTLVVSGSVDAAAGGINNGTLVIDATSAATIKGTLPTTTVGNATACGGGTYSVTGTTTAGPVTVNCTLSIGATSLTTLSGGGLTVGGSAGKLVMTTGGVVDVAGQATFGGLSEAGSLTNGKIVFRGGLAVNAGIGGVLTTYAPSGSHGTLFDGGTEQHVAICATCVNQSLINNVEFRPSSHVYFDASASFNGLFTARTNAWIESGGPSVVLTVNGDVTTEAGSRLDDIQRMDVNGGSRFPQFASSSPMLLNLNADLAMTAPTSLSGDLVLNNMLTVGAQALFVTGSLTTQGSTGTLKMQTAGGNVTVGQNAAFSGASTDGLLTNGTLEVRGGNFTQSNIVSSNSFRATGSHLTKLTGTAAQNIFFLSTAGSSQFNDLSVENTSASGVTVTSVGNAGRDLNIGVTGGATTKLTLQQTFNVGGNFNAKAGAVPIQSGAGKRIIVTGAVIGDALADLGGVDSVRVVGVAFPVYNNTATGKAPRVTHLTPSGTMNVSANGTIAGAVSIQGPVNLNGRALVVKENFTVSTSGSFDMSNTAGTLTVGGDFAETGGIFTPPANALVTLNGTAAQTVNLLTASSKFGNLNVTNASGATLASNVSVFGTLDVGTGATVTVANGRTLTFDNAAALKLHSGTTFTINGAVGAGGWACQAHDGTPSGAAAIINGTNASSTDGSGFVSNKCSRTSLP